MPIRTEPQDSRAHRAERWLPARRNIRPSPRRWIGSDHEMSFKEKFMCLLESLTSRIVHRSGFDSPGQRISRSWSKSQRIQPWAETTETLRQYTGLASRVSGGMGVPCSRSNPNRVCGDGLGAATASIPDVGVSAGRDGSASANWFTETSFLSRSAISSGGSSATVGTGTGSASGTELARIVD